MLVFELLENELVLLWIDSWKIKYCLCQLYSLSGHPQEKLSSED